MRSTENRRSNVCPDRGTVEHGQPAYGRRRLRLVVDNEARDALIDNLGY